MTPDQAKQAADAAQDAGSTGIIAILIMSSFSLVVNVMREAFQFIRRRSGISLEAVDARVIELQKSSDENKAKLTEVEQRQREGCMEHFHAQAEATKEQTQLQRDTLQILSEINTTLKVQSQINQQPPAPRG